MSAAELEAPRPLRKPGDTDAVTFSWADVSAGLYGLARVASGRCADGDGVHSALAVALRRARDAGRDRRGRRRAAARARPRRPRRRWSAGRVRGTGELEFELTFEALTPPAEYGGRQAVVKAGGMEGYEQLCRVRGTMDGRAGRRARPARALVGQPGLGQDRADARGRRVVRRRLRRRCSPRSALDQGAAPRRRGDLGRAASTPEGTLRGRRGPRLSTTTDEAGRQIRAGLELWLDKDDDYPYRGARRGRSPARRSSSARCGSTSRSSAGTSRAARASAATTSSAARDQGRRQRLRRRRHAAADRRRSRAPTRRSASRSTRSAQAMKLIAVALGRAAAVHARARPDHRARVHRRRSRRRSARCSAAPSTLDGYGARLMGELRAQRAAARPLPRAARRARRPAGDPDQQRARVARRLAHARCASTTLFELVVDSAFEGMRKPEPEIYAIDARAPRPPAEACVFVDDVEVNVAAAREAGHARHPLPRHRRR